MAKKIASKLDRYAEQLAAMEAETPPKTLREMQAWLAEEGVRAEQSTIGRFLESLRSARSQESILRLVVTGRQHCEEIDSALKKNPAPQLETLINLFKVLVMQLTSKGAVQPKLLPLADQLSRTAIEFISGQTKAAFKERELAMAEQKFAETKKDEQTKALELCLEDAKAYPAVQELFKAAFSALRKAKAK